MRGAEDGLGEHDDRPLSPREKIAAAAACMIVFVASIAGGDALIFFG